MKILELPTKPLLYVACQEQKIHILIFHSNSLVLLERFPPILLYLLDMCTLASSILSYVESQT
jgi:hypothetical protein